MYGQAPVPYGQGERVSGFTPYSAGRKMYGGGRDFPTMGRVDNSGYRERDLKHKARLNAILRRMQAGQAGRFASADFLRNSNG